MQLNCDLGEDYGSFKMPVDAHIMQHIDQANIACGFHAGDPLTIKTTLQSAIANGLEIGAHPSYPDLVGFGRRSMKMGHMDLVATIQYQVSALQAMCRLCGSELSYVKPHGALYNDIVTDDTVRLATIQAVSEFKSLELMIQATNLEQQVRFKEEADKHSLGLIFEAFIDRRYQPDGRLVPRSQPGAVLTQNEAIAQAKLLIEEQRVLTQHQQSIEIQATSLCIHGDNPDCIGLASAIRPML
ncbi:5-oxoprolinase subunit PxpA [Alteromonas facilis]|uniref:5-oxoprolinase subunit PxpA n=1 Tax=Alteromonas facilis TaxID=2048004 RepID=UPI000C283FC3|nr:5-oxoprolinase subunit PxpA [Alteromonas facilis]